ncbi:MAG TPA: M28 family peptidase [Acidobacteriaceae bacterium]|nr:M28 family peptidase [Acidobacteriaceae bacterium]
MNFLASDALRGRGSATRDEHIAALFAAAQFQTLGLEAGGDDHTFIQKIRLTPEQISRTEKRMAAFEAADRSETWNAIGILRGTDASGEAILLSAHLDHLGVGPPNAGGDTIYNGADDDASGTTAVLALARELATGPRPRRTVIFALFGSEELGGFGNAGFLDRPPVPLKSIVANLEFEMIGRPDPAVPNPEETLWLTGYDRSDLGPELARHGANLVADPHPGQNFFRRSDNYPLDRRGIIAHTVSSFGLHEDYHKPSDELATIDFPHMERAIQSMVAPIRWLAHTSWRPVWNPEGRP